YDVLQLALSEISAEHGYDWQVDPLDIYDPQTDASANRPDSKAALAGRGRPKRAEAAGRHLAFRITLNHFERTLTTEEVNHLLDELAATARKTLKAVRL